MEKIFGLIFLILIIFNYNQSFSQDRRMIHRKERLEKIEALEQQKIKESLNLDDETANKLFLRRKELRNSQRNLIDKIDSLYIDLENQIENNYKNEKYYSNVTNEILSLENEMQNQRRNFINSLSDILSNEQKAKYLVFERNFRKELQKSLSKHKRRIMDE